MLGKKGDNSDGEPAAQDKRKPKGAKPGMADYLAGEVSSFNANLKPFLPQELVGGSIPQVAGTEEESVWNAASQACGTEKVHFSYTVEGGRCWYIACPSSSLASHPDSWCPLAAALPGNSEFWDRETVYLYEQEGLASALRWDPDTGRMQVFLGAGRTLLPRIQSMDANFVTVNAEMADVVPWKNRMMMTEKLSRATARMLLIIGIILSLFIFSILVFQYVLTNTVKRDLKKVKAETNRVSQQLMIEAYNALQSDTIKHMVRIQELLDELRTIDGTLVKYEVKGKKLTWEVLVPPAYGQGVGTIRGKVLPGIEPDGRVRVRGHK
ncbi:MAG: hypothetical protein MRY79_09110 [Alphaproteobacteria bacterium]|nr:hypothetical protein [Alphaproteobacteria bacterium]